MMNKRILLALALGASTTVASAHTGHDTSTLMQGLVHPFGADHLLAMVAVGLWSASVLKGAQRAWGPVAFLLGMTAGALAGIGGLAWAGTELGIALSVLMFGLMLLAGSKLSARWGLAFVAAAASLHGLAHGAEMPVGASVLAYAAGFLASTAALHVAGLGLGQALRQARAGVWRLLALSLSGAGVLLVSRL
ncbi:HupE/UreJ family protein [Ideonella paludis]|nr:HupE/UreJ family protein [Ideonella paludis]